LLGTLTPVAYRSSRKANMDRTTAWVSLAILVGIPSLTYFNSVQGNRQEAIRTSDFFEPTLSNPVFTASIRPPVVTRYEFDMIRPGMSHSQASLIIGGDGEEMSSSRIEGVPGVMPAVETIMYHWVNANGSNMNAMFQNDRLISKAQFGLK
jgi:hypothetical protein